MNTNVKKILGDGSFIFVGDLIVKLKGLLFLPLIIGKIGLHNYGVLIQALLAPGVVAGVCSLSLGTSLIRFSSKLEENEKDVISEDFFTVLVPSFFLSLLGCLAVFLLSGWISDNLLEGASKSIIQLASIMVINEVVWRTIGFYLKARKRFKPYSILTILYQFTPYLGLVAGIYFTENISTGLKYMVSVQAIVIVISYILYCRKLSYKTPSIAKLETFFYYSWPLALSNISGGLLSKSDRFLIGYFLEPSMVGVYSIIYMILSFIDQLTTPLRTYFGSYLPKVWDKGDRNQAYEQIQLGMLLFISLAGLLLSLAYVYMYDFIDLYLLDLDLEQVNYWEMIVLSIGIGIILLGMSRFQFQIIRLAKKNQMELYIQLIGLSVSVILNVILLPLIGILGAGLATFLGYLCAYLYGVNKLKSLSYSDRLIYIIPGAISFLVTTNIGFERDGSIYELILYVGISLFIYSITLSIALSILNKQTNFWQKLSMTKSSNQVPYKIDA